MKTKKSFGFFLFPQVMVASQAFYGLEPQRNLFAVPTLCVVDSEDETGYRGYYPGLPGLFNLRFPKESTRSLTAPERSRLEAMRLDAPSLLQPELFQVLPKGAKPAPVPSPRAFQVLLKPSKKFQVHREFPSVNQERVRRLARPANFPDRVGLMPTGKV